MLIRALRPALEQVLEPRNADVAAAERKAAPAVGGERVACVRGLDLRDGKLGEGAGPIRRAVQSRIVERQHHSVAGDVRVRLEVAVAERHRRGERLHRVLGRLLAPPRCAMATGVGPSRNACGRALSRPPD
jgi:hypothetical protein